MYQKGDVVLIPFPFSDLTITKTRPAVVVSISEFEKETGDFTVAMITYRLIDERSKKKYGMSFKEFEDKNIVKEKGLSWEVEKDAMDCEHALEGITKEFISKTNPLTLALSLQGRGT